MGVDHHPRDRSLEASEARQRGFLEAALDCVIMVDAAGCVVEFNPAAERTFGYSRDNALGRNLGDLIVPPSLREQHLLAFTQFVESRRQTIFGMRVELTGMRSDGSEFPVELALSQVEGEPLLICGAVRDLTEPKRTQDELLASRRRLVHAGDDARRKLGRDLHDGAQQRLVFGLMKLQLANERLAGTDEATQELLRSALEALRGGLDELRDLAAGLHPYLLTSRGLEAAIEALADRSPIPLTVDVPSNRYPMRIEADVYFIVAEALTNIAKHADASRAEVVIREDDDHLAVEIRDDGAGGANVDVGTGLRGLNDRIDAVGGTFRIESPAGQGTLLTARLPFTLIQP